MRITLQQELEQLEADLATETELVLRALRGALNSLLKDDAELAAEVIDFDEEVDARYLAIHEGVQSLLARQTPVAVDLRQVLAILHVNLHLERIGDYCVTMAKLHSISPDVVQDVTVMEAFSEMGARAEEMIRRAHSAFIERDLAGAESLVALDEEIDRINRNVLHYILSLGGNETMLEWGLHMLTVSRCLERIGDHAVDIGEQTAYLITGEFREFTDASGSSQAR